MLPQLIIVEDDAKIMASLVDSLTSYGFAEPVCFADTEQIVERIAKRYDRPTLLLSDYCVPPAPLGRYLPNLRATGIALPTVVLSGRIRAEQINDLMLIYPVRGFFEKGPRFGSLLAAIAKHLIDLGPEAFDAWDLYRVETQARELVRALRIQDCEALMRLIRLEESKPIAAETGVSINTVYALRSQMLEFLGKPATPKRYQILHAAVQHRLRCAATT